jgi:peptidyl-dipeptidase Dcp
MPETTEMTAAAQADANPLLQPWQTPFETRHSGDRAGTFLPAFEQAFADHAAEISAIEHDPAVPDFANTITALERSGKTALQGWRRCSTTWCSAHSNPDC